MKILIREQYEALLHSEHELGVAQRDLIAAKDHLLGAQLASDLLQLEKDELSEVNKRLRRKLHDLEILITREGFDVAIKPAVPAKPAEMVLKKS